MHGAVNEAIQDLVVSQYGIKAWKRIAEKCNFPDEYFLSNRSYDDDLTFDIVNATHEETGMSADEILIAFGEFWVLQTGMKKYGALLKAGGSQFEEFILYLPHFHSRIMLLYPKIIPPEFEVVKRENGEIVLNYHSKRNGLTMFVFGLIQGIAKMFKHKVSIQVIAWKEKGAPCDQFLINY